MSSSSKNKHPVLDNEDSPASSKRAKTEFRAWSRTADDKHSSTVYTLKCTLGNPNSPVPSWGKSLKKEDIQKKLKKRGLSTEGKKAVLLERLQKELPYVKFDMDSRECLQRVIHMMLQSFGWDSTHCYKCTMPRRGDYPIGTTKYIDCLWDDTAMAIRAKTFSADPNDHKEPAMRTLLEMQMKRAGLDWNSLAQLVENPEMRWPTRYLDGSACDALQTDFMFCDCTGGYMSLEDLALSVGDTICVEYDLGQSNYFYLRVVKVEERSEVLPEIGMRQDEKMRATFVESGNGKIRSQYH